MPNEEETLYIFSCAKAIKDYCAGVANEEECPFFRGYKEVAKDEYTIECALSKEECSPCCWELIKR